MRLSPFCRDRNFLAIDSNDPAVLPLEYLRSFVSSCLVGAREASALSHMGKGNQEKDK